jgi:biotin carboxylase
MSEPVFLVLGGGNNSVLAVKKAKELGYKVLLIDDTGGGAASNSADYFELGDPLCFECVEKIVKNYPIIGSITRTEYFVPTCCYLNEALGLPSQGTALSNSVRDKWVMHQLFQKDNVQSPTPFYKIENQNELQLVKNDIQNLFEDFSFIVKPADQRGSIGITKIRSVNELDRAVKKAMKRSPTNKVLVEKFVEGIQLGVQGFSVNGKLEQCFISRKVNARNFVPLGHSFSISLSPSQIVDIQNECAKALRSLGILNGPSTIDLVLDVNGNIQIFEIGARVGGTILPETILFHSGIDLIEASILLAAGRTVHFPIPKNIPVSSRKVYFKKRGKIIRIKDYSHLIEEYQPLDFKLMIHPNMKVRRYVEYGHVICTGATSEEAEAKCKAFILKLRKLIET